MKLKWSQGHRIDRASAVNTLLDAAHSCLGFEMQFLQFLAIPPTQTRMKRQKNAAAPLLFEFRGFALNHAFNPKNH